MYKDYETPKFWLTYSEALEKYLLKRIDDKSVVEDILHDVYLKIFCYCKRFDFSCEKAGVKNLRSWVFQVCHNTMLDYYKQRGQLSPVESLTIPVEPFSWNKECNAEGILLLLNTIPKKYSVPVYYDSVLQLKQSEIAKKIGLSLPATKSRIQRGKKMLIQRYREWEKNN